MLHKRSVTACCALTLFFAGTVFSAAETVALHPLKGELYEIAEVYFGILQEALLKASGSWSVYVISEDEDWPDDIPPGGFSAFLCPRPTITGGSPYAFTGEVAEDPDYDGHYRLRLYFWDMQNERMLAMDELTAPDPATCEQIMPLLLDNLFIMAGQAPPAGAPKRSGSSSMGSSWDPARWIYVGPANSGRRTTPTDNPEEWIYLGPERDKWWNLGLRGGGGSSQWFYNLKKGSIHNSVSDFWNVNAALQLAFNFTRWFAIQTEANFAADIGMLEDGTSSWSWSMTVPVLLRVNLIGSHLRAGLYAGAYYYLPLAVTNGGLVDGNAEYKPDLPGVTFGISVGWKAGAGNIFLDGRFEYDGLWYDRGRDPVYYRNSFKMNIGYEWGLGNKADK